MKTGKMEIYLLDEKRGDVRSPLSSGIGLNERTQAFTGVFVNAILLISLTIRPIFPIIAGKTAKFITKDILKKIEKKGEKPRAHEAFFPVKAVTASKKGCIESDINGIALTENAVKAC